MISSLPAAAAATSNKATKIYKCEECPATYFNSSTGYVMHALQQHHTNCLTWPKDTFQCPYIEPILKKKCQFTFSVNAGRFCEEHYIANHPGKVDYSTALERVWKADIYTPTQFEILAPMSPNLNETIVTLMQSLGLPKISKLAQYCKVPINEFIPYPCLITGYFKAAEKVAVQSAKAIKKQTKKSGPGKETFLRENSTVRQDAGQFFKQSAADEPESTTFKMLTANVTTASLPTFTLPANCERPLSESGKKLLQKSLNKKVPSENMYVLNDKDNSASNKRLVMSDIAQGVGNIYYLLNRKYGTNFLNKLDMCVHKPSASEELDATKLPPSCPQLQ
jgi:hypothetical protein